MTSATRWQAEAKEGLFTEAQVKEREALAAVRTKRRLQANPDQLTSQSQTAQSRGGQAATTPSGPLTVEGALSLPVEKLKEIRARENGQ